MIRDLKSADVEKVRCISGIVIQVSSIEHRADNIVIQCKFCGETDRLLANENGRTALPRQCRASHEQSTNQAAVASKNGSGGGAKCGLDPYVVIAEKCHFSDVQYLKLQERPEDVASGEMARTLRCVARGFNTDVVTAGQRVVSVGIFSGDDVMQRQQSGKRGESSFRSGSTHFKILGILVSESSILRSFSEQHQQQFLNNSSSTSAHALSARDVQRYHSWGRAAKDLVLRSIAPSIASGGHGSDSMVSI